MPLTLEEYRSRQEACLQRSEWQADHEVEVRKDEPFSEQPLLGNCYGAGQYSYKIHNFLSLAPKIFQFFAPKQVFEYHEETWKSFPYSRKTITCPRFDKNDFFLRLETLYLPNDRGQSWNVFDLPSEQLSNRVIQYIDIFDPTLRVDLISPSLVDESRLNSPPQWSESCEPVMTCYKRLTGHFRRWQCIQNRTEKRLWENVIAAYTRLNTQIYECGLSEERKPLETRLLIEEAESKKV